MENDDYGERIAIMQHDGHLENAPIKALTDYPSGFVIYAGWDVDKARQWINENGLTQDHVKLVRRKAEPEDQILVVRR